MVLGILIESSHKLVLYWQFYSKVKNTEFFIEICANSFCILIKYVKLKPFKLIIRRILFYAITSCTQKRHYLNGKIGLK